MYAYLMYMLMQLIHIANLAPMSIYIYIYLKYVILHYFNTAIKRKQYII